MGVTTTKWIICLHLTETAQPYGDYRSFVDHGYSAAELAGQTQSGSAIFATSFNLSFPTY